FYQTFLLAQAWRALSRMICSMAKLIQYTLKGAWLVLFSLLLLAVNAQPCKLIIHPVGADSALITSLQLENSFDDKTSCIQYVNRLPQLLAMKGYAAASIDSSD